MATGGWIDLLVRGFGQRRGRRDPQHLRMGDVLEWSRVAKYQPDHPLRLTAETKVPGRAWPELEVNRMSRWSTPMKHCKLEVNVDFTL